MNLRLLTTSLSACVLLSTALLPVSAEVKMPAIFGDHMVLQQDVKIPVWGWAAPNEKVNVTLGSQAASATADADGNWRVNLAPLPVDARATPLTMTVAGTNTITYKDVLIGDVWLASGQSNMEFGAGSVENAADILAKADEPMLRLFFVIKYTSLTPLKDIHEAGKDSMMGHWQVCTPDTLRKNGTWSGFSAVAYFFGREIQHTVGHPVGLIAAHWGGTPAQSWISLESLQKDPALAHYVTDHQKNVDGFARAQEEYPAKQVKFKADMDAWEKNVDEPFKAALASWQKAVVEAKNKGTPLPAKPSLPQPKPKLEHPDGGPNAPSNLFDAMINPIIPYALKGAIWYQGESNGDTQATGEEYAVLFPRMITDWRERWGLGDFPFFYVQLANYGQPASEPVEGAWPWLREAQLKTLSLPNTGMAVSVDIGNPWDIHPKDKLDVGLRLALAAKHVAYGQDIVYSGPIYDSIKIDRNKAIISFKYGEGLKIAAAPWAYYGTPYTPTSLTGFAIAGEDKKWVWAKAEIVGGKVVVSSDAVAAPVAVRYAWANAPWADLYNGAGLPASPFRTDNWEDSP